MSRPLISCIVPVYNCAAYLEPCIASLIDQRDVQLEIVAVDDGSTDGSAEILDRLAAADSRIVAIHQENAGGAAARNRALDVATGDYLMLQDADDLSHPHRARLLFEALESRDDIDFCGSANWLTTADTSIIGVVRPSLDADECAARMPHSMAYCHASIMFRRDVMNGPEPIRYNESLRSAHDYEMLLRVCARHRGANIEQPLYTYRFSGDQLSIRQVEAGSYRSLFASHVARTTAAGDPAEVPAGRQVHRDDIRQTGLTDPEIDEYMVGRFRHAFHMMAIAAPKQTEALRRQCAAYIREHRPAAHVESALRLEVAASLGLARRPVGALRETLRSLRLSPRAGVDGGVGLLKFGAHVLKSRRSFAQWRPPGGALG